MEETQPAEDVKTIEQDSLSKAERKRLRRAEKTLHREREVSRRHRRRLAVRVGVALVALGVIGFIVWTIMKAPTLSNEGLVSKSEVHWHARLDIRVRGEDVVIPANIGIPLGNPTAHPENMHTHAEDRIVHIEKLPPVYEADLKLGNFFEVWGKEFNARCVVDTCIQDSEEVTLKVNGKENTQFEHYLLRDGDQVEITLE